MESFQIAILLDFYGQLLTENQFKAIDMHYNSDLSLAEVADEMQISRQGAYDFIKKGKDSLWGYEEKLGLVRKFTDVKKSVERADAELIKAEANAENPITKQSIETARSEMRGIVGRL